MNDAPLARQYREILTHSEGLSVIPLSPRIAEEASRIRALHDLRTPDAVQLATAIAEGAPFFLTNDARIPSLPRLRVLVLDELRV